MLIITVTFCNASYHAAYAATLMFSEMVSDPSFGLDIQSPLQAEVPCT